MSWIAAYIPNIAQFGWATVVFTGLGIACIVSLVTSVGLIAWRYFSPIAIEVGKTVVPSGDPDAAAASSARTPTLPQSVQITQDAALQNANSTKLQDRIYVARMFVDVRPLDADHYVSIGAACLNLYDQTLTLRQTLGTILLAYRSSEPGSSYETVSLMPPQALGDASERIAQPQSEFNVAFNQLIPGAHVTRVSEALYAGGIVEFNFSDLQLELVSSSGEEYYFKLWHGVHVSFSRESPYISRVTIGTGTTRRNIVRPI